MIDIKDISMWNHFFLDEMAYPENVEIKDMVIKGYRVRCIDVIRGDSVYWFELNKKSLESFMNTNNIPWNYIVNNHYEPGSERSEMKLVFSEDSTRLHNFVTTYSEEYEDSCIGDSSIWKQNIPLYRQNVLKFNRNNQNN